LAVRYDDEWYIGIVAEVSVTAEEIKVECMRRLQTGKPNHFGWPMKKDCIWYSKSDILCAVEPPCPVTNRNVFALRHDDESKVISLFC
jgi:hypothetical protein